MCKHLCLYLCRNHRDISQMLFHKEIIANKFVWLQKIIDLKLMNFVKMLLISNFTYFLFSNVFKVSIKNISKYAPPV